MRRLDEPVAEGAHRGRNGGIGPTKLGTEPGEVRLDPQRVRIGLAAPSGPQQLLVRDEVAARGNECFEALAGVTEEQQALADAIHSWFVSWIKDPSAGPGWDKVSEDGGLVKLGVPGDELERIPAKREEFNQICRDVYDPYFPEYPVLQSVARIVAGL